jgi:hypothetical protein
LKELADRLISPAIGTDGANVHEYVVVIPIELVGRSERRQRSFSHRREPALELFD